MKFSDILKLSFNALRYRKLRSFLTMLGVIIGSSLIIVLTSQTTGLNYYFISQFSKSGINIIYVLPTSNFKLSLYNIPQFSSIDGVKTIVPIIMGYATVKFPDRTVNARVVGVESAFLKEIFPGLKLIEGSYPSRNDYVSMLMGYAIAFPTEEDSLHPPVVGQITPVIFRYDHRKYSSSMVITGILESYGSIFPFNIDDSIIISIEAADAFYNMRHYYSALVLVAEDVSLVDSIVESINILYSNQVRIIVPSQMVETVSNMIRQVELFLEMIAAFSLIVASIGIANIMFISVIERTRFIGLFKALGATSMDILLLFLSEAILISFIGGVIGCLLGISLSYVVGPSLFSMLRVPGSPIRGRSFFGFQPVFTPELIVTAFTVSLLAGLLAGLYPAYKASKLDPVIALRSE